MASSPRSKLRRERGGLFRHADDAAEHADHLQDLGDAALVEREDRVAALHELGRDVGLQIREREDEVGLERLDLVVARVEERRHLRLLPRLRRPHRVAGDADDAIALAEQVERLGGLFGEADDAAREHRVTAITATEPRKADGDKRRVGKHKAVAFHDLAADARRVL